MVWLFAPSISGICSAVTAPTDEEDKPVRVVTALPREVMGWWSGDGDSLDSLRQNNAKKYGAVTYVPGMVGEAFHFDGAKSFVKVATSDLDPSKENGFTLEMWMKADELKQIQPLAGWGGTSTPGISFWVEAADANGNAKLGADLRDTGGNAHRMLSDAPVILERKWHHVALTYRKDTGVAAIFCDGQQVRERNLGALEVQTSFDFSIGKHIYINSGNTTFKGAIDEVTVSSRGLDPAEILEIYRAKGAGKQMFSEIDTTLSKEERWATVNKRLTSFNKKHGGKTMSFASWIDGADLVHIQGDKVWFVHQDWDLPGTNGGANDPTWVNGEEWIPTWTEKVSDKRTIAPALPQIGELQLIVDVLKLGGTVYARGSSANLTIEQQPTAENNYEAILRLDDNNDPGAHWFIFSVSWDGE